MDFIKMQGTGNDYIFIDNTDKIIVSGQPELAKRLSNRNYGIGGDGIVLISKDDNGIFWMNMWNLDGSEGKMCGNAIRCVAKYLYENNMVNGLNFVIQTLSGPKDILIRARNNEVYSVCVNMGKPYWETEKNLRIKIENQDFSLNCVSIGNPHCVIFTSEIFNKDKVEYYGKKIQEMDIFPNGVNVEFVKKINEDILNVQVFERGSGYTLSCGTGACASAAVFFKQYEGSNPLKVILAGGDLFIKQEKNQDIILEGDCVEVFKGKIKI
ncbi:MAG: diaminopimelate epimerase [Candidatus Muirbacterium halophilum]|nr:diaminopimelate epimerase [Candidatus Muirbacterium halophilum]MCK9474497.1 diaminopimelate epimerase [Candidatus Muirbacterium halophilum]